MTDHEARAYDEATILLLRATSPIWVLYEIELHERFGVGAYENPLAGSPLSPRAERVECVGCGVWFLSEDWGQKRWCSRVCAARARRRRAAAPAGLRTRRGTGE